MKKSRLLKSVITLALFYWVAGWVSYSFLLPQGVEDLMSEVPSWMTETFGGRPISKPASEANFLESAAYQWSGIRTWSVPVIALWLMALAVGGVGAFVYYVLAVRGQDVRIKSVGSFRGAGITLGTLPTPPIPKHKCLASGRIKLSGLTMNEAEMAFLGEIMGLLQTKVDAYAGAGHGVGLYEHTLNVIGKALEHPECDSNLVLAAAAHDIGKLLSFKQLPNGTWTSCKLHAQESARLIAGMPSWYALPEVQRESIRLAVKYDHCPEQLPVITDKPGLLESAKNLMHRLGEIDGMATAAEKAEVKKRYGDLGAYLFDLFVEELKSIPLNTSITPRNAKTVGQKRGNQLALFEPFLREYLVGKIDKDLWAALGGNYRGSGQLHEFTSNLMRGLDQAGWLVKTLDCIDDKSGKFKGKITAPANLALWYGQADKMKLNGVIVVRIPDEHMSALPATDNEIPVKWYRHHGNAQSLERDPRKVLSATADGEEDSAANIADDPVVVPASTDVQSEAEAEAQAEPKPEADADEFADASPLNEAVPGSGARPLDEEPDAALAAALGDDDEDVEPSPFEGAKETSEDDEEESPFREEPKQAAAPAKPPQTPPKGSGQGGGKVNGHNHHGRPQKSPSGPPSQGQQGNRREGGQGNGHKHHAGKKGNQPGAKAKAAAAALAQAPGIGEDRFDPGNPNYRPRPAALGGLRGMGGKTTKGAFK